MRKVVLPVAGLAACVLAYGLWPLLSAFQIRQAVHTGDVAVLERKVQWQPVRESLKASLAVLPAHPNEDGTQASFWSRIKAAAEPMIATHMIDTYMSADGIGRLQQARRGRFFSALGLGPPTETASEPLNPSEFDQPMALARALGKFVEFYSKIIHARFDALDRVEFEIADHPSAPRHLLALFELSGLEWKMTSLRVVGAR